MPEAAVRARRSAATILLVALGLVALWAVTRPPGPSSSPVLAALGLPDQVLRDLPMVAVAAVVIMALARYAPAAGGWLAAAIVLWLLLQYEEAVKWTL